MQKRFVITGWTRMNNAVVPTHGHYIGPGKRSVNSIQRKLAVEMFGQLSRKANGRYAWGLNRLDDTTMMPDPLTRQVRRAQERAAAKKARHIH